jgi:hypothetical protein
MTTENYLMIPTATNIVENVCLWDGDTNTWQPPVNTLMLIQAETPAMVWEPVIVDKKVTDWVLLEQMGVAGIGFTWDGTVCTTNEPKPTPQKPADVQPITTGTTTI